MKKLLVALLAVSIAPALVFAQNQPAPAAQPQTNTAPAAPKVEKKVKKQKKAAKKAPKAAKKAAMPAETPAQTPVQTPAQPK
ncbi:MAG: hypothetical protein WCU88_03760 [Elusimicrobiota bacterium]|jgi:hypothetical protein